MASAPIDFNGPLKRLPPTGGWLSEPTSYAVRAEHAEQALDTTLYIHLLHGGKIPRTHRERVAHSRAGLPDVAGLRQFRVWVGHKPGPGRNDRWLSTEISLVDEPCASVDYESVPHVPAAG